jgi:hypothetical protein
MTFREGRIADYERYRDFYTLFEGAHRYTMQTTKPMQSPSLTASWQG